MLFVTVSGLPETAFGEITSSGSQILATRDAAAD
jgi:hypothetical protein